MANNSNTLDKPLIWTENGWSFPRPQVDFAPDDGDHIRIDSVFHEALIRDLQRLTAENGRLQAEIHHMRILQQQSSPVKSPAPKPVDPIANAIRDHKTDHRRIGG